MDDALAALAAAFRDRDRRPAVFDREIRKAVGEWALSAPVPVSDLIPEFRGHPAFVEADGRVLVPLHRADSAALTGEYLFYLPDHVVPCVAFYDFSTGGLARIPLEEFDGTYPAWRLRFFHPDYDPPTPPSYLPEGGGLVTPDPGESGGTVAGAGTEGVGDRHTAETGDTATAATGDQSSAGTGGGPPPGTAADGQPLREELHLEVSRQEVKAREETRSRIRSMPPGQFLAGRGGIESAVTAGVETDDYGQQVVSLRIEGRDVDGSTDIPDDFGIYPGSEVVVDSHDGHAGFPAEAEVLDTEGRSLSLSFYWDRGPENPDLDVFALESGNRFLVGELLNPVPFERKREAIDQVCGDDRKLGWLTGSATVGVDADREPAVSTARLNESQYRAAYRALRATDFFCIHGPPGTGKTRTVVELVRTACENGDRVLATAHSNQAVDNLLVGDSTADRADPASLHRVVADSDLTAARVGGNSDSDLVAERYADTDPYEADVVCATMSGAHRFGADLFDLAVVDEATQASIPATLIPLARAERAVLVGDHRQLPPYHSTEESDEESMSISLFERFQDRYGSSVRARLRTQYRMHEAIAAFPNEAFYDGALDHGEKNCSWTIDSLDPLTAIHVQGEEAQGPSQSYRNEAEADVVAREAERLFEAGIPPEDIGVITPYAAQVGTIRGALLDCAAPAGTAVEDVKVATIDAFQGSEREAILVSFVRSNPEGHSGFLTFPTEGPRRLNVALTRARRRLVLVGNFDTLRRRAPTKSPEESCADVYEDLYQHLRERDLLVSRAAPSR